MYRHHTLEEKKEILRLHASGASMSELMKRFHVRDHYLYILFGRYEKYGLDGLLRFKERCVTDALKQSVEYLILYDFILIINHLHGKTDAR